MIMVLPFFVVALLYSIVGFGGGSSYIAILALFGTSYQLIPQIALLCNITVVLGGVWHFSRRGHFSFRLLWPFLITSIPFAYLGGRMVVSKELYYFLLGSSLLAAGGRLLFFSNLTNGRILNKPDWRVGLVIGASLGLLSGMVGIGGGIFLAPILMILGWGTPKQVATSASYFILLNSIAGLAGQWFKAGSLLQVVDYWPLLLVVFIGGQIGSHLGAGKRLSQRSIRLGTAALVVIVGVRLLLKSF